MKTKRTNKGKKMVTKPSFKPTDEERKLVEQMCAVGIPQESICLVVRDGIDDKTLRKHFRRELDTAKIKANAKVGGALFNKIMNGDTAAGIFWAKTQMGWKEKSQIELEHKGNVNFNIEIIGVEPDKPTD
tara:strand:- start:108 stop:497 length:390 start_codon:yes stop_codon:yes gene_type:complete